MVLIDLVPGENPVPGLQAAAFFSGCIFSCQRGFSSLFFFLTRTLKPSQGSPTHMNSPKPNYLPNVSLPSTITSGGWNINT